MTPDLTVIIVSWNSSALLSACLHSFFERESRSTFEVIVVDNASADDTVSMVRSRFPEVRLIVNDSNLGFSVANNIGIRQANGRYILLLNPDTELPEERTLDRLVQFMDARQDVGAAGCELTDAQGHKQVSAGYSPGPATLFAFCFFLSSLSRNAVKGLCLEPVRGDAADGVAVDWVSAACMIVRRAVLSDVGLLNEDYFLYGEDIEWGCRISRSGWPVRHIPSIRVHHVLGGTQRNTNEVSTAWIDGLARVYMEIAPRRSWLYFKLCLCSGIALRAVFYGLSSLLSRDPWRRRLAVERLVWLKHLATTRRNDYRHHCA